MKMNIVKLIISENLKYICNAINNNIGRYLLYYKYMQVEENRG